MKPFSIFGSSYLYFMYRLVFFLFVLLSFCSCKNEVEFKVSNAVFRTGDQPEWAGPAYHDQDWLADRDNKPHEIFWVRYHINFDHIKMPYRSLAVEIHSFGAFEVYWDGIKIGENGKPALTSKIEVPGTFSTSYLLPDSLSAPGAHVLALRATQMYRSDQHRRSGIRIEYYSNLLRKPLIIASVMNLMAGAFFMVAVYYLLLYINRNKKNPAVLIFSLICFLFFMLMVVEYCKFYIPIPYPYFYTRLEVIGILTFAIALLIPLYFSIQFGFNKKWWLTGGLFIVLLVIYIYNYRRYDLTAQLLCAAMWIAAMVVTIYAILKKEKASWITFLGLIASLVLNKLLYYDFAIFISFTILVFCMLNLYAIRAKEEENAYESSLLLSSRLKLQLLKKNIQPHFIKNTLTSLMDWVEESPEQGVVFIKALAAEFDIMNEISEAKLIPVSSEIVLCKAHLSVMEFRKEINYQWEEINIDPDDLIPPAILHTILENGITHSLPPEGGSIHFVLSFKREKGHKEYTLLTHGRNRPVTGRNRKGTGFQYIAARLTESYGKGWTFESHAVTEGWRTTITINE